MPETGLNIKLLEVTRNALAIIYAACRQCYSLAFAGDVFEEKIEDIEKQTDFVRKIVASGHESPLEHVKFTFAVEGVSRALTHQLVRHRLASYSQQSQRYVNESNFDYVIPPAIRSDPKLLSKFEDCMKDSQSHYNDLVSALKEKGRADERANEDARFVLPQAAETKIVVTMNCRELIHFFKQRCCSRAQWEIKRLADIMLEICRSELAPVFSEAGAKCETLKYCPEGERFSCGRYPVK